jgi:hypothetical protein
MASASPVHQPFFSCTDYHCDTGRMVTLTDSQWREVRDIFAIDTSPSQEREEIRRAIALLEQKVGAITGTWRDLGGNVAGAGEPGQLDCISESKNTTTYLQLMSEDGLLKWHAVEPREVRHPFIFDVHWSAVIRDRTDGKRFVVDSWFLDNGHRPMSNRWRTGWMEGISTPNETPVLLAGPGVGRFPQRWLGETGRKVVYAL